MKRLAWLCIAGASIAPSTVQAHLTVTGMGPIYDGIAHFAISPEDSLPLVALAFFVGLRDSRHTRPLFFTLPIAWFVGGVLAMQGLAPSAAILSWATAALFLVTGGLLAANLKLSVSLCAILGIALAIVRGLADFSAVQASGANLLVLLGVCASVVILFSLATSVTLPLERLWMIVAARVYGSWIAAVGLFLMGWIFRYCPVLS